MALVLVHPDAEEDSTVEKFDMEDGIIILKSKSGPLTISRSLFLLKLVEAHIMNIALGIKPD